MRAALSLLISVELASSCDERFLRKRETPIAQKVGIEVGSSAVGNCPNGALSLVDASILQQRGHGRGHQLKPNVVDYRWERDRFRHCTNVDLFELCCGKQNPDFIVARKDMLGSFDACCVRPQAIISALANACAPGVRSIALWTLSTMRPDAASTRFISRRARGLSGKN